MVDSKTGLLEREKEVLRLIEMFNMETIRFIVIGGYAVSTYKKRFSIDLDIVIQESDLLKIEGLLSREGYIFGYKKEISLLYGENFKRFTKKMNNLPVDVDLLINGLVSRTTDSTWSFSKIDENSIKRNLDTLDFLTPIRELLICQELFFRKLPTLVREKEKTILEHAQEPKHAIHFSVWFLTSMKIHSGRLSDTRDIVALMPCDKNKLKEFLFRGNLNSLKNSMKHQLAFLEKPQFDDSFKGIFGIKAYNQKDIEFAKKLYNELLQEIKE